PHARRRSAAGRDVQLYLTQQESAAGASAAADSIHRGSGFRSTVTAIQQALRTRRSAVDRSREAAAGLVAAVAVLSAKRAAADGATGFRWFVGLSMDDAVWDASTFSKNRERMLEGDIAEAFFQGVLGE